MSGTQGGLHDYETLVAHAPICIHEIDLDGRLLSMNPAGLQMLELPLEQVTGRPYLDFVAEEDRPRIELLLDRACTMGEASNFDFTVTVGGETRHFTSGFVPVHAPSGELVRLMGLTQDVSRRVEALESAHQSESRFRDLAETAAEFFWEVDCSLRLIWATGALGERWSELANRPQTAGRPFAWIRDDAGLARLKDVLDRGEAFGALDVEWQTAGESHRTVSLSAKPVRDGDGTVIGWRGSGSDVTSERALAAQLRYHATHDELTGLLNRREFARRIARLLDDADTWAATEHVLCFVDLDQFKVINDTSGHRAGDELLRQLATVLRAHVRGTDLLARLGGDEFGIVLHGSTPDDAKRMLDEMLDAIGEWRFTWGSRVYSIGASVGVVGIGPNQASVDEIMAHADTACYAAKDQGRNRWVVFNEADSHIARRRDEIDAVSMITKALDRDLFRLHAQPIMPIGGTGDPRHIEVLVRMYSEERQELVAPGEFLAAAEQFGMANRLDLWVVEHTLQALEGSTDIEMCAINLSGVSLGQAGFLDQVSALLDSSAFDPARICFEVTETSAITNMGHADTFISTLRARGCLFSLDDFGSGLASFAYLKNLDVDYVKIDGSFVRNVVSDPVDRALVRSITEIGRQMGKTTIAEWVDSAEVLDVVAELGVDMAQGYHIGYPVPIESLLG